MKSIDRETTDRGRDQAPAASWRQVCIEIPDMWDAPVDIGAADSAATFANVEGTKWSVTIVDGDGEVATLRRGTATTIAEAKDLAHLAAQKIARALRAPLGAKRRKEVAQ